MSIKNMVIRYVDKHRDVKDKIIQSECKHQFEPVIVRRQLERSNYDSIFNYGPGTYETKVMVCKKCGRRIEL